MKFSVHITPGAVRDVEEIHAYILAREGAMTAARILEGLYQAAHSLLELPRRGHPLPELMGLVSKDVLEIHFKPYRIIYRIVAREIFVMMVADGRRNFDELLSRRILQ